MVWKWLRRRRPRTPLASGSGTKYLTRNAPSAIVGEPSLFYIVGSPQLVYITWGAQVRLYVIKTSETGRQRIWEPTILSVVPGSQRVSIDLGDNKIVQVPRPGTPGTGTWAHRTLSPLRTSSYVIVRDRLNSLVSIQPKN